MFRTGRALHSRAPFGVRAWYTFPPIIRSAPSRRCPLKPRSPHDGVYARIGPSRVHGVGVLAIRDIPAGTLIFHGENERVVWVSRARIRRLLPAIRKIYEDFGMLDGDRIGVPPHLHNLSVCWYVNHSDRPNVEAGDDGRFRALRRIREGEELTADYRTFSDEELQFGAKRVRAAGKGARKAAAERP